MSLPFGFLVYIYLLFSGWLCDVTGRYDATFFSAGICVAGAGLVYLILPVCKQKETRAS